MEFTRRHVAAAAMAGVGGLVVGNALWDEHLLCPDPDAPVWDAERATDGGVAGHAFGYWGPPVVDDGTVYVTTGHGIVAGGAGSVARLDRETGAASWVVEREPAGVGTPAVDDDVVYVPTGRNELLALAASDGDERWRVDAGEDDFDEGESFALEKPVPTGEGVVVQAFEGPTSSGFDGDHVLAGVDAADGNVRWTHALPARGRVRGVGDGDVVVACEDGTVRRVDGRTGDVDWRLSIGTGVTDVARTVANGVVVVLLDGHVLGGIDAEFGELDWRERVAPERVEGLDADDASVRGVAVAGERALAASASGEVVAVDRGSGEERWRSDAGAPAVAVHADADRGVALALDARGFAHVHDLDDGARTGRLVTDDANYGDTCGRRVRKDLLPRWFLTVRDGSAYVATHSMRRYDLP
ncbi:outer membrane protein assembly factor BamB family protein [Halorubellus salinus]|uniref:outer membrane protein assembly factor BamB family protein n=1 Tax=Halorubellus salinus TaxID=755309 RepID=UPI001D0680DB|nr:PQQ-binding-like beta-propeller repeat protein [Halorubellus salinus]